MNPDEVLGLCEPGACHDVPDGGLEVAEDIFGLEAEEQPLEIVQEVDIQLHAASEGQLPATIPPKGDCIKRLDPPFSAAPLHQHFVAWLCVLGGSH